MKLWCALSLTKTQLLSEPRSKVDSLLQLEKVNATLREYVDVDQAFSIYMFQLMTLRHQLNLVNLKDQRRMVDLIRLLRVINRTIDCQSFLSEILFKSWADKVLRLFYLASLHFSLPATIVPFLTCCVLETKLDCLWIFICIALLSSEEGRLATCQWLTFINRYLSSN